MHEAEDDEGCSVARDIGLYKLPIIVSYLYLSKFKVPKDAVDEYLG